jgi:hypothetical protein
VPFEGLQEVYREIRTNAVRVQGYYSKQRLRPLISNLASRVIYRSNFRKPLFFLSY